MKNILRLAAIITILATSAQSQVGFSNGGISASYNSYDSEGGGSFAEETSISAYGVFNIASAFDIQAGVGYDYLEYSSTNNYSDYRYDLHAIYNFSNGSRLGVFYANTDMWELYDMDSYGLEYQFTNGPVMFEIQGGSAEIFNNDINFITAAVDYTFGDFTVGGGYGYADVDVYNINTSKTSVNIGYVIPGFGAEIYAEYALLSSTGSVVGDNSIIEVGLHIPFGAGNKTPFESPNRMLRSMSIHLD